MESSTTCCNEAACYRGHVGDHDEDGRAVFNIAGNKYRVVVWINYPYRVVYVRFIGTHAEYDKVDVQQI